jgi:hypothetical protein
MSLAEYRTSDRVDVSLVDPLASRLLALLEHFGGRVLIVSGRRSWGEQQVLWLRYLSGGPLAARPGTSNHERGAAADLRIVDPSVSWREVHAHAETVGLWFPILSEDWHCEVDANWTPPPEEPEDMSPAQMAHLLGCELDEHGRAVVPVGADRYPLANVIAFILDEVQRDDLLASRIAQRLGR